MLLLLLLLLNLLFASPSVQFHQGAPVRTQCGCHTGQNTVHIGTTNRKDSGRDPVSALTTTTTSATSHGRRRRFVVVRRMCVTGFNGEIKFNRIVIGKGLKFESRTAFRINQKQIEQSQQTSTNDTEQRSSKFCSLYGFQRLLSGCQIGRRKTSAIGQTFESRSKNCPRSITADLSKSGTGQCGQTKRHTNGTINGMSGL